MEPDDPKDRPPHPERALRLAARDARPTADDSPLAAFAPAPTSLTPEERARGERLIRSKGLQAARQLEPRLAGHCIQCGEPVPGSRAFCSDRCISARVHANRERVAAIAREAGWKPRG